jgi:calcineurin-like phosphoesterase family protein
MRWFISDTHFGHKKVIEYSGRPFSSVEEMDNTMIARWNNVVGADDEVYMLGDFGLANFDYLSDIFHSLSGNKILVRGNHDGNVGKMKRMGWDHVVEGCEIKILGTRTWLYHIPGVGVWPDNMIAIHGHIHEKGKPYFINGHLCVCVELWDYAPVSETQIEHQLKRWRKQQHANLRLQVPEMQFSNSDHS